MENFLYDYGLFVLFAVIFAAVVLFGRRKQKWCPKCKQASCVAIGKPVNDRQNMSCPKCGFSKQVNVKNDGDGHPIDSD